MKSKGHAHRPTVAFTKRKGAPFVHCLRSLVVMHDARVVEMAICCAKRIHYRATADEFHAGEKRSGGHSFLVSFRRCAQGMLSTP